MNIPQNTYLPAKWSLGIASIAIKMGAILLINTACSAYAQFPNAKQLEGEQQRVEAQRKLLFDNVHSDKNVKNKMPQDAAVEKERWRIEHERKAIFGDDNLLIKNYQNNFPNIPTPQVSNIDIETIARRYEKQVEAQKREDIFIFASFTMPQTSLKRLIQHANKLGASVIFNGFKDNSFKAMMMAVQTLGEDYGNVVINPKAFAQYKIKSVPTVVLAKAAHIDQFDQEGCALPEHFVAISGDVSLDYALEEFARRAPSFAHQAIAYLRQVRGL